MPLSKISDPPLSFQATRGARPVGDSPELRRDPKKVSGLSLLLASPPPSGLPSAPPAVTSFGGGILMNKDSDAPSLSGATATLRRVPSEAPLRQTRFAVDPVKPEIRTRRAVSATRSAPGSPPPRSAAWRPQTSKPMPRARSPVWKAKVPENTSCVAASSSEGEVSDVASDSMDTADASECGDDDVASLNSVNASGVSDDTLSSLDMPVRLHCSRTTPVTGILGTKTPTVPTQPTSPQSPQHLPRGRSLVFVTSPEGMHDRLPSQSRSRDAGAQRRRSGSSATLSGVSSPGTLLFDSPPGASSQDSDGAAELAWSMEEAALPADKPSPSVQPEVIDSRAPLRRPSFGFQVPPQGALSPLSPRQMHSLKSPVTHPHLSKWTSRSPSVVPRPATVPMPAMDKAEELALVAERLLLHQDQDSSADQMPADDHDELLHSDDDVPPLDGMAMPQETLCRRPSLVFHRQISSQPRSLTSPMPSTMPVRGSVSGSLTSVPQPPWPVSRQASVPVPSRPRSPGEPVVTSPRLSVGPSKISLSSEHDRAPPSAAVDPCTVQRS